MINLNSFDRNRLEFTVDSLYKSVPKFDLHSYYWRNMIINMDVNIYSYLLTKLYNPIVGCSYISSEEF